MRTAIILFLLCLYASVNVGAQQLAPERTFEEMLAALPVKEMKEIAHSGGKREDKYRLAKPMNEILRANAGKKWTLKFVKGKGAHMISPPNSGKFHNAHRLGIVRVNDIKYYVTVEVFVQGASLMNKADDCREGQKVFVSGTVRSLFLEPDAQFVGGGAEAIQRSNMLVLHVNMTAGDIGPQKQ